MEQTKSEKQVQFLEEMYPAFERVCSLDIIEPTLRVIGI